MSSSSNKILNQSNLNQTVLPKGLDESVVITISQSKNEPNWLLNYRLKAYRLWKQKLDNGELPTFAKLNLPAIDFQAISYLATIKKTTDLVELKKEWISKLN